MRTCSLTSMSRDIVEGVSKRCVLNSLLFNVVMAALTRVFSCSTELSVRMAVCADDLFIWCVDESRQSRSVRTSLQKALSAVSSRRKDLSPSVSLSKTASMIYRPQGRIEPGQVPIFLDGQRIQRVRTYEYLVLTIDDKVTWRPTVSEAITLSRRILCTFRQVCGSTRG